jgi:hypothetical protein
LSFPKSTPHDLYGKQVHSRGNFIQNAKIGRHHGKQESGKKEERKEIIEELLKNNSSGAIWSI